MCMTCGCKNVSEDHGDKRQIVADTLVKASEANNQSMKETLSNLLGSIPLAVDYLNKKSKKSTK